MGRCLVAILLAGMWLVLGQPESLQADSWLMTGHDAHSSNSTADRKVGFSTAARLHRVWSVQAHRALPGPAPVAIRAIATDKRVFLVAAQYTLFGFPRYTVLILDARSGHIFRIYPVTFPSVSTVNADVTLAYADRTLVVGTIGGVEALNVDTGQELWRWMVGATSLVISGKVVYTGKACIGSCGAISASAALTLHSGTVLWEHPGNGGEMPLLLQGHLYQQWTLGPQAGITRIYSVVSGKLQGEVPWYGFWTGTWNRAYAYVHTVGATTLTRFWLGSISPQGNARWKLDLGPVVRYFGFVPWPVLANGTLYVASHRFHAGIIAVNAARGRVIWAADVGSDVTLMAANHLLFVLHRTAGTLEVLNAATGFFLRRMRIPGYAPPGTPPALFVAGGTVYVVDARSVTALRP